MFVRYSLRTLDVDAARAFYGEVLDLDFAASSGLEVWPLHEQARARGAPAHWLGQLPADDVDPIVGRLIELGAERLGPTLTAGDGATFATLRDPTGAVVAVRSGTPRPARVPVAWHHLNARDVERAWSVYSSLFGWQEAESLETGSKTFAWDRSGVAVGSMMSIADRPGAHAHWLFCFPVADLEASLTLVRARGGKTLEPTALPNGQRVAACDDPQGAAFGLLSGAT